MARIILVLSLILYPLLAWSQDPWSIRTDQPLQGNYYGITSANGQIGLLSSRNPLQVDKVVVGGLYDLNGDGSISGSVTRDMLNRQRGIQSCIGAVEYTGNDHPAATDNLFVRPTITDGAIYSVTGQYMGTDIHTLPHGIYIVNGQKIIQ